MTKFVVLVYSELSCSDFQPGHHLKLGRTGPPSCFLWDADPGGGDGEDGSGKFQDVVRVLRLK